MANENRRHESIISIVPIQNLFGKQKRRKVVNLKFHICPFLDLKSGIESFDFVCYLAYLNPDVKAVPQLASITCRIQTRPATGKEMKTADTESEPDGCQSHYIAMQMTGQQSQIRWYQEVS